MIVTKTPFRVTLGGGGTDLPSFYSKHGGMIFAMGISKYMYICINRPPLDSWVRLKYHESEKVPHASELAHDLAREALVLHGLNTGIEVASIADFSAGTGLGSSSCYLVGLLNAIRTLKREPVTPAELAEEACHIEIDILKKPVGKQDQYMAAFGGFTVMEIEKNGKVKVRDASLKNCSVSDFVSRVHLYYTGVKRDATDILANQDSKMKKHQDDSDVVESSLLKIKDIGYRILEAVESGDLDKFGCLCDEHWQNKMKLSKKITVPGVNEIYEEVKKRFGVLGGKISGAGGGGFLMLYAPQKHGELTKFMEDRRFKRVEYSIDTGGSRIMTAM